MEDTAGRVGGEDGRPRAGSWLRRGLGWGALAAFLAVLLQILTCAHGIGLSPDGWGYWQGSVSLLQGRGYRYFFGPSITYWPPLYAVYLEGWQYAFGVSGLTLVLANLFLTAAATFSWTALFLLPLHQTFARQKPGGPVALSSVAVVVYLSGSIAHGFSYVLAHNLVLSLLPLAWSVTYVAARPGTSARVFLLLSVADGGLLALLLLTHNSCLAFLPPVVLVLLGSKDQRWSVRGLGVQVVCLLGLVPWVVVRTVLRQWGSHPVGWGGSRFSPAQYAGQLLRGTAEWVGPPWFGLDYLLLAVLAALIVWAPARGRSTPFRDVVSVSLRLALGSAACLVVLFSLTYVQDELAGRFVLFLPLTVFPAAVGLWCAAGREGADSRAPDRVALRWRQRGVLRRSLKYAVPVLVCFSVGTPLYRVLNLAYWRATQFAELPVGAWDEDKGIEFAFWNMRIDPTFVHRAPVRSGDDLLVSPPYYRWIKRRVLDPDASESPP